eukprot:2069353-Rhodomonas_salina.1
MRSGWCVGERRRPAALTALRLTSTPPLSLSLPPSSLSLSLSLPLSLSLSLSLARSLAPPLGWWLLGQADGERSVHVCLCRHRRLSSHRLGGRGRGREQD